MISWKEFYNVLVAMMPLYVAMFLAYGAVRWWKIFTPEQCSGINRYVAMMAIPVLSFKFIAFNNLYEINLRFISADTLQKIVILVILGLWSCFAKKGGLGWSITLFSLSTLPNTLVIGIPLLQAMYGDFSASLCVQVVVLQSVVWYTLLLFLFEYRAAKILINQQFPNCAQDIKSVHVDSDVHSLADVESLQTDAEVDGGGKLRVSVRRPSGGGGSYRLPSIERFDGLSSKISTPRASNLSGVEIYSIHSSSRASGFDEVDSRVNCRNSFKEHLRNSSCPHQGSNSALVRSLSNNREDIVTASRMRSTSNISNGMSSSKVVHVPPSPVTSSEGKSMTPQTGLHMYVWTSNAEGSSQDVGAENFVEKANGSPVSIKIADINPNEGDMKRQRQRPPTIVLLRLILGMMWRKLIRNPNTYASVLGVLWSLISFKWHIHMPSIVTSSISIIANTGLGMAMFSLGLFMASQPKLIACGKSLAGLTMVTRFLIGPVVIAATSLAIGIRGALLQVAIMQAALPQGIVPFVYSKEYGLHADIQSTATFLSLALGLPVAIVYNILLQLVK